MPTVYRIDPILSSTAEKLRVCAYARVSSDSEDQLNSFASQVNYYTKYIQANEKWIFVDIYADEGITGTSAAGRDEFQRLMQDCRQGRIDRILVKSVSRFARNVQDCLEAVRELKQLGVSVMFEKERIDTALLSSEMMLSMMSAFAQEESVSISKNLRRGAVMRMKNGTFRLSQAPYGYRLDAEGRLCPQPEEAAIVRRIYDEFLSGMSIREIACKLESEGIPKLRGEPVWTYMGVQYILTNERYAGDEMFQKRYTTDTLPFKKEINRGQKTRFYISDTHEAIVPHDVFDRAKNLLAEKKLAHGRSGNSAKYTFTSTLCCGECGTNLCRRVEKGGSIHWTCRRHLQNKQLCGMKSVSEKEVEDLFLLLHRKLQANRSEILDVFVQQLEELAQRQTIQQPEIAQTHEKIAQLLQQSHTLHHLWVRECIDSAFFLSRTNEIDREVCSLRTQLKQQRSSGRVQQIAESTNLLVKMLEKPLDAFQAEVFRRMVRKVTITQQTLQFQMINGLTFEEKREQ